MLPPLDPASTPIAILSEGCFGEQQSKTALGVIRYGRWPVVAVIDSVRAGKTVGDVTDIRRDIPVVAGLDQAMAYHPKALLLGIAPPGGGLPEPFRRTIAEALDRGLHILNGLHVFLNADPGLARLAKRQNVCLWDVRNPDLFLRPGWEAIVRQLPRPPHTTVVTFVGSDCSVGKMHAALALQREAARRGQNSRFVATGQTGILIEGDGLPLDRVIGDFMAGTLESLILETAQADRGSVDNPCRIFVEGQGSLLHPAYSGVTLALLHGSNPDGMILCHKTGVPKIRGPYHLPIAPLPDLVVLYETAAGWIRPAPARKAKIIGIALNTVDLSEHDARRALEAAETATGLPATDPVRYGVDSLLNAVENCFGSS